VLYGKDIGSNYQGQLTMLSKHFTEQTAALPQPAARWRWHARGHVAVAAAGDVVRSDANRDHARGGRQVDRRPRARGAARVHLLDSGAMYRCVALLSLNAPGAQPAALAKERGSRWASASCSTVAT